MNTNMNGKLGSAPPIPYPVTHERVFFALRALQLRS
jgi:hypothetical protein